MATEPLTVLHIDPVKEWRGGQQQLIYLHAGLLARGHRSEVICQPDSELAGHCKKQQYPFSELTMHGEWDIGAARKIARYACEKGRCILHLHSAHALSLGLIARLFNPNLKLVASRRVDFSVRKPLIGVIKYNNRLLDRVVCISDKIRDVLLADGVDEKRVSVIKSGIDLEKFKNAAGDQSLRAEFSIPEDHKIVGTVAALAGHKDYPNLLRAAKQVLQKNSRVTFCALGDGPAKKQIFELAGELELGSRFIFAGFRRDVGSLLKQFDLFVLASKKEGMGTSLLDAQLSGLPVVATRAGGIPEVVEQGKSGLLVPPGNPQQLAETIINVLDDDNLREKMGRYAAGNVARFDINRTIDGHVGLYQTLLNS